MSITVSVQKSPSLHWCLLLHLILVVWFGSGFSFLIEVACSLVGWWLPWGSHRWQACTWRQIAYLDHWSHFWFFFRKDLVLAAILDLDLVPGEPNLLVVGHD